MKNQRIIVLPTTFCSEMKLIIHQTDISDLKIQKSACQVLFWPLINSEIEDMIRFILIVFTLLFYNSKFAAVENLKNLQSLTIINKCKKTFLQYGIPKLITENGLEVYQSPV